MDFVPILSNIVLIATGVTIVLAVGSYVVFRLRDLRKQKIDHKRKKEEKTGPKYFTRYFPEE